MSVKLECDLPCKENVIVGEKKSKLLQLLSQQSSGFEGKLEKDVAKKCQLGTSRSMCLDRQTFENGLQHDFEACTDVQSSSSRSPKQRTFASPLKYTLGGLTEDYVTLGLPEKSFLLSPPTPFHRCQDQFPSLEIHQTSPSPKLDGCACKGHYKCSECTGIFFNIFDLLRHLVIHNLGTNSEKWRCSVLSALLCKCPNGTSLEQDSSETDFHNGQSNERKTKNMEYLRTLLQDGNSDAEPTIDSQCSNRNKKSKDVLEVSKGNENNVNYLQRKKRNHTNFSRSVDTFSDYSFLTECPERRETIGGMNVDSYHANKCYLGGSLPTSSMHEHRITNDIFSRLQGPNNDSEMVRTNFQVNGTDKALQSKTRFTSPSNCKKVAKSSIFKLSSAQNEEDKIIVPVKKHRRRHRQTCGNSPTSETVFSSANTSVISELLANDVPLE